MPGPANPHLIKICIEMQLVEQGTKYQKKWVVSGDIVPTLAHLKCQDNSSHLMVPHCKCTRGRNSFLPFPKGAIKEYLVPSSYGIVGSMKCGGNSNLIALKFCQSASSKQGIFFIKTNSTIVFQLRR